MYGRRMFSRKSLQQLYFDRITDQTLDEGSRLCSLIGLEGRMDDGWSCPCGLVGLEGRMSGVGSCPRGLIGLEVRVGGLV